MPITKYINGDLLDAKANYIAHGVNCQGVMGSGVAKVIKEKFPEVYREYSAILNAFPKSILLGYCQIVPIENYNYKGVLNLFTQFNYGYDKKRYVNYKAIVDSFTLLNNRCNGKLIAIPKIGAGLGGGDWNIIKELIDDSTPNTEIHVYYLK